MRRILSILCIKVCFALSRMFLHSLFKFTIITDICVSSDHWCYFLRLKQTVFIYLGVFGDIRGPMYVRLHVCVWLPRLHGHCVCMFALKHSLFVWLQMLQHEHDARQTFVKRWREGARNWVNFVVDSFKRGISSENLWSNVSSKSQKNAKDKRKWSWIFKSDVYFSLNLIF